MQIEREYKDHRIRVSTEKSCFHHDVEVRAHVTGPVYNKTRRLREKRVESSFFGYPSYRKVENAVYSVYEDMKDRIDEEIDEELRENHVEEVSE